MVDSAYMPTLCIDFDGVIHSYERGWQGGVIYGTVVPGFFEWCDKAQHVFKLVVYSSRSSDEAYLKGMMEWLIKAHLAHSGHDKPFPLHFSDKKPPAWITIDDRCVQFLGKWDAIELQPDVLLAFKPWNART